MLTLGVAHRQPASSNQLAFRGEKQPSIAGRRWSNSLRNSGLRSKWRRCGSEFL